MKIVLRKRQNAFNLVLPVFLLQIAKQVDLLRDLDSSSEHLQAAVGDCLEKHVSFVNQFTQVRSTLKLSNLLASIQLFIEIGRASCRERV